MFLAFRESSDRISGGGCTKDAGGNLVLLKDQDSDAGMVSSIINSMESHVPVGLIIGLFYQFDIMIMD